MNGRPIVYLGVGLFLVALNAVTASGLAIDLSNFERTPQDLIVFSQNNTAATFSENNENSPVTLVDWEFFVPTDAASLTFTYDLFVAINNEDYFDFYLGDPSEPLFSSGGLVTEDTEGTHFTDTVSFPLSSFRGTSVPLIFHLMAGSDDVDEESNPLLDSTLTISNLTINPVPEPGSFLFLVTGLAGFIGSRRIRRTMEGSRRSGSCHEEPECGNR